MTLTNYRYIYETKIEYRYTRESHKLGLAYIYSRALKAHNHGILRMWSSPCSAICLYETDLYYYMRPSLKKMRHFIDSADFTDETTQRRGRHYGYYRVPTEADIARSLRPSGGNCAAAGARGVFSALLRPIVCSIVARTGAAVAAAVAAAGDPLTTFALLRLLTKETKGCGEERSLTLWLPRL